MGPGELFVLESIFSSSSYFSPVKFHLQKYFFVIEILTKLV